jgi:hypothetical protein
VVHELEVPDAAAGRRIETDDRFTEETVAGPMAAVEVGRRSIQRQVDVAEPSSAL